MKRYGTTIGAGLSLLIGMTVALAPFPNAAGARAVHTTAAHRLTSASAIQAVRQPSSRALHAASRAHATRPAAQQRRYRSGLRATRGLTRSSGSRRYSAAAAASGRVRHVRSGVTSLVRYAST